MYVALYYVLLHLRDQAGVPEGDPVAHGGA